MIRIYLKSNMPNATSGIVEVSNNTLLKLKEKKLVTFDGLRWNTNVSRGRIRSESILADYLAKENLYLVIDL